SLLVPDEHYRAVAEWVDATRLRGRLVYYRVREARAAGHDSPYPDALSRKLDIRSDSGFYAWLERELERRFDHVCCDDMDRFRREARAITRAGQIKTGGARHEKDDRHAIDDRSRYVLGWSNESKIRVLAAQRNGLEKRIQEAADDIARLDEQLKAVSERLGDISRLEMFEDFQRLDWHEPAARINELEVEYRALREESDVLRTLRAQLDELENKSEETEQRLEKRQKQLNTAEERTRDAEDRRTEAGRLVAELEESERRIWFEQLAALREDALGEQAILL